MPLTRIYCIDGSGSKDQRIAERKRPIFRLDLPAGAITRVFPGEGQKTAEYFSQQIRSLGTGESMLIAADVPIGLPLEPADVYQVLGARSFLGWLDLTCVRLATDGVNWRDGLIVKEPDLRTALKPLVSIPQGKLIGKWAGKRRCDLKSRAESIYCVDNGAKQVGKAALQFWFEVFVPLRKEFDGRVAVWPFEAVADEPVIIAECYPAAFLRKLYKNVNKRDSLQVAGALSGLAADPARNHGVDAQTWIFAASSEDEFDMFSTAFALRDVLSKGDDLLACPNYEGCRTLEGWMLGLSEDAEPPKNQPKRQKSRRGSLAVPIGTSNRNDQKNLGPSGNTGAHGPRYKLQCCRLVDGVVCGHIYETNAQDVFQKNCPTCQI